MIELEVPPNFHFFITSTYSFGVVYMAAEIRLFFSAILLILTCVKSEGIIVEIITSERTAVMFFIIIIIIIIIITIVIVIIALQLFVELWPLFHFLDPLHSQ
jgi:cytochrome c oxidase subunit IV